MILSAFQFHNVRLMLLSGIGEAYDPATGSSTVGRNFAYQNMATIRAFFNEDVHANGFIGAGGAGVAIDDFNADNFDHGPEGFVGGSPFWVNQAGSKPISGIALPSGTPGWGSAWKAAIRKHYAHTVSMDAHAAHMSYRDNYLSLDPTHRDAYGQPLLRMTLDWKENDIRQSRFMADKMRGIAEAMGPDTIGASVKYYGDHFDTTSYQTTHLNGGPSWGPTPRPVRSTAICKAGTSTMSSCRMPRPSRRGWDITRPGWSPR